MKKPYRKVKQKEPDIKKLTFNEVHELMMNLIKLLHDDNIKKTQ